jgi:hypothetical protein
MAYLVIIIIIIIIILLLLLLLLQGIGHSRPPPVQNFNF